MGLCDLPVLLLWCGRLGFPTVCGALPELTVVVVVVVAVVGAGLDISRLLLELGVPAFVLLPGSTGSTSISLESPCISMAI